MIPSTVFIPLLVILIGILLYVYPYEQKEGFYDYRTYGNGIVIRYYKTACDISSQSKLRYSEITSEGTFQIEANYIIIGVGYTVTLRNSAGVTQGLVGAFVWNACEASNGADFLNQPITVTIEKTSPCTPQPIIIISATYGDSWTQDTPQRSLAAYKKLADSANANGSYSFQYKIGTDVNGNHFNTQHDSRLYYQQYGDVKYRCGNGPDKREVGQVDSFVTVSCPQTPCPGRSPSPSPSPTPTQSTSVVLYQHCDKTGWVLTTERPGTYTLAKNDFPEDASYIDVPNGLIATLKTASGETKQIQGPGSYSFCDNSNNWKFNDKTVEIQITSKTNCPSVSPVPSPSPCPKAPSSVTSGRDTNSSDPTQNQISIFLNNLDLLKKRITTGYVQLGVSNPATVRQAMQLYGATSDKSIYDSKFVEEKYPEHKSFKQRKQSLEEFVLLFFYISYAIFAFAMSISSFVDNGNSYASAVACLLFFGLMSILITGLLIRYA
jgi:hypothetical protein